jgi:hypothetical protein
MTSDVSRAAVQRDVMLRLTDSRGSNGSSMEQAFVPHRHNPIGGEFEC